MDSKRFFPPGMAIGACALLLGGCAFPMSRTVHAVQNGSRSNPPPLREWKQTNTVRFLLVHGMSNYPFGAPSGPKHLILGKGSYDRIVKEDLNNWEKLDDRRRNAIAKAAASAQFPEFIEKFAPKNQWREVNKDNLQANFEVLRKPGGDAIGYVLKREFLPLDAKAKPVAFYIACWSVGVAVKKERRYGSDDGVSVEGTADDHSAIIDTHRNSLNRALKFGLVDWGLTDASIYIGSGGEDMEWCVAKAMEDVADDLGPDDRVAVVTASLGSTVTFNAMQRLLDDRPVGGESFRWSARTSERLDALFKNTGESRGAPRSGISFYMFANQYGLLTQEPNAPVPVSLFRGKQELNINPLNALEKAVATGQARVPVRERAPVQVIAFTDPDDLLSFKFPLKDNSAISVRNAYVRNNYVGFYIPFTGSIANPMSAHVGYEKNPAVLSMILNGK